MKRFPRFPRLGSLLAMVMLLSACSGEPGSTIVHGVASKGPLNGAAVCAYAITAGAKGLQIGSCTVTDASGNYRIDLGTYTGSVLFQAVGGTYVDEATSSTVALTIPLRSVTDVTGDSTRIAITALTELAYQNANALAGGLTRANIQTATANVQSNFGVADIVHVMPVDAFNTPVTNLNLVAVNIPAGATSAQLTYGFALATISRYSYAKGASLETSLQTIRTCLVTPATGCATADGMTVGANLVTVMQSHKSATFTGTWLSTDFLPLVDPTIGLGLIRTFGNGPVSVATGKLNDSGVTASQCYQAGSNALVACNSASALALNSQQDGMTGRDANLATNSNGDGKLGFSFTTLPGGCVQDNNTGLVWEVKTTDGGVRDRAKTYAYGRWMTIFNLPPIGAPTTALDYVNMVNATNLCGYSDWRLPTIDELHSIVDYSVAASGKTIDTSWFPDTQSGAYWSSSDYNRSVSGSGSVGTGAGTLCISGFCDNNGSGGYSDVVLRAGGGDGVWLGDFSVGSLYGNTSDNVEHHHYVRLMRADPPPVITRYTLSGDGQEVTDNKTGLIWRRCAEGMVFAGGTCSGAPTHYTHEAALQQAATQAGSSGVAWCLPDIKELSSIADKGLTSSAAIGATAFPATPVSDFWSASPYVGDTSNAWFVYFGDGTVSAGERFPKPSGVYNFVDGSFISSLTDFYASALYASGAYSITVVIGDFNVRLVRTGP